MNDIIEKVKIALEENNEVLIKQIEDVLVKNEKLDFTKMKSGDRFLYRGIEWIYLGVEQGGALCITANCYKEMFFDRNSRNNWNSSSLKEELNGKFLNKLDKKDLLPFEMDLVADDGDDAYGTSTQYVGILSCDQYRKYRKVIPLFEQRMWTCTPWYCGPFPFYTTGVRRIFGNGTIDAVSANFTCGVVPVCVFSIK